MGIKPNHWSAGVEKSRDSNKKAMIVSLASPSNGIIGKATLTIDTEIIRLATTESDSSMSTKVSQSSRSDGPDRKSFDLVETDTGKEEDGEQKNHVGSAEDEEDEDDDEEKDEEEEEELEEQISTITGKHLVVRYVHGQPIYFLFNPWNKGLSFY